MRKNVDDVLAGLWQGDTDQSRITAKVDKPMVGANLSAHLDAMRAQMRKAAENLEFEEAARLRDEIRRLEADELGLPDDQKRAPIVGRSNEGKPGTRKGRFGKESRKGKWGR